MAPVLDDAGAPIMAADGTPLSASPNQLNMARDRLANAAGMPASAAAASIPAPGCSPTSPRHQPDASPSNRQSWAGFA